jgi:hypothetical protein
VLRHPKNIMRSLRQLDLLVAQNLNVAEFTAGHVDALGPLVDHVALDQITGRFEDAVQIVVVVLGHTAQLARLVVEALQAAHGIVQPLGAELLLAPVEKRPEVVVEHLVGPQPVAQQRARLGVHGALVLREAHVDRQRHHRLQRPAQQLAQQHQRRVQLLGHHHQVEFLLDFYDFSAHLWTEMQHNDHTSIRSKIIIHEN